MITIRTNCILLVDASRTIRTPKPAFATCVSVTLPALSEVLVSLTAKHACPNIS